MARKAIPEKHAPEDINVNVNVHSQHSGTSTQSPPGASIDELQPDGVVPVDDQVAFEELQSLFTFNLGWAWQPQPVETAVGSGLDGGGGGPFPYALGFQTGDPQTIGEFESWTSNSV